MGVPVVLSTRHRRFSFLAVDPFRGSPIFSSGFRTALDGPLGPRS
jgi:hypothetical protein